MNGFKTLRLLALLIAIAMAMTTLLACGKKGPVRPKLTSQPAAPQEVTLAQQGEVLILGWTLPELNRDGSKAEDLGGFRILRLNYPADGGCPTCRDPQETVAEISLRYPPPAQRLGKRFYWRDARVSTGTGYRYAIVPLTTGGLTGEAALVHRAVQRPPAAPADLQVEAGTRQLQLTWSAPQLADGETLLGYNLYRRSPGTLFSLAPLNPEPLEQTRLTDVGLESGRTYEYRVSSLVRVGDAIVESVPTAGSSAKVQ